MILVIIVQAPLKTQKTLQKEKESIGCGVVVVGTTVLLTGVSLVFLIVAEAGLFLVTAASVFV